MENNWFEYIVSIWSAFIPQSSPPANITRFDERLKFLFDEFASNGKLYRLYSNC